MVKLLPKWVMRRYILLRKEFGDIEFSFKQAQEILNDDSRIVNLLLSELRRAEWLTSKRNPKDPRKKIYQLMKIENIFKELEKKVEINV